MKPVIVIINGPNLNLLGKRQPEIYGSQNFESFFLELRQQYSQVELVYNQTNHEGTIIDILHKYGFDIQGFVLNAGAFTHTSIAIADAIRSITTPVVEVHISDIYKREDYRHVSYLKEACIGSIVGKGLAGYKEAVDLILTHLN